MFRLPWCSFGIVPSLSKLGSCFFFSSKQKEIAVYSPHTLHRHDNSLHTEAVMCIYIRSLDQARGLLARGALVLLKAVSSDCRHPSSGYLCAANIHAPSLPTSKLSCCLLFLFYSKYLSSLFYLLISQHLYYFVEQSDRFSVPALSLLSHFMPHIIQKLCLDSSQ